MVKMLKLLSFFFANGPLDLMIFEIYVKYYNVAQFVVILVNLCSTATSARRIFLIC